MATKTLFLDAGGVLVFPNWERVADALARHGVLADPGAMAAAEPLARRELDTAADVRATTDRSRGEAYWRFIFAKAGVPMGPGTEEARAQLEDYHARHNLWESMPADVIPALGRVRGSGVGIAVVSNSNGTVRKKLDRLGLAPYFDLVVDSAEEGVEKPNPRIFEIALERMGAERTTTLHVGDLFHVDVVGARAAGIDAALLDPLGLYPGADCRRFSSLSSLAAFLAGDAS